MSENQFTQTREHLKPGPTPAVEHEVPPDATLDATEQWASRRAVRRLTPRASVLVVGDHRALIGLLVVILSRLGLDVQSRRPTEIDVLLSRARPNLVVLDLPLPPDGTLRLCRRLRQDPTMARVPVVALVCSGDTALRARVLAAGATVCLDKPFRLRSFHAAIQQLLGLTESLHTQRDAQERG